MNKKMLPFVSNHLRDTTLPLKSKLCNHKVNKHDFNITSSMYETIVEYSRKEATL